MDINQQYDLIRMSLLAHGLTTEKADALIEASVIPDLIAKNPGLFLALPPQFWQDRLLKHDYFRSEISEIVLTK